MHQHEVLLVEPDSDTRSTLLELIEEEGHCVREARDGQEALVYLHASKEKPCLILLDSEAPGMTGWQVAEKLAADEKLCKIPLVILDGQRPPDPRLKHVTTVEKPLRVPRLLELIGLIAERCSSANATRAAG